MAHDRHAPPISLFSFQDIITCLTGVMMIVVLLLILSIVQQKASAVARVIPPDAELVQTKAELAEQLRTQQKQLAEQPPVDALASELAADKRRHRIAVEIATLRRQTAADSAAAESAREKSVAAVKAQEAVAAAQKALEEPLQQHEKTLAQAQTMAQKNDDLRRKIEEQASAIRFTVDDSVGKTPLLIDCRRTEFKIWEFGTEHKVNVGDDAPDMTSAFSLLEDAIRRYPAERYYPVLLVRTESAPYYELLWRYLKQNLPGYELGYEPIAEQESLW